VAAATLDNNGVKSAMAVVLELEEEDELCRPLGRWKALSYVRRLGRWRVPSCVGTLRRWRVTSCGPPRRWRAPLVGGVVALGGRRFGLEPGATICRRLIHRGEEEVRRRHRGKERAAARERLAGGEDLEGEADSSREELTVAAN
jgi:hypothetical protein